MTGQAPSPGREVLDDDRCTERPLAGVLIGGASRRMGQAKQLVDFDGTTMVERVVAAVEGHVEQVLLIGAGPVPPSMAEMPRLEDARDCRGPMAGILAALRHRPDRGWIIAACDLPLVTGEAVAWLLDQRRCGSSSVLPRLPNGIEPLLAVYERQARPLLEALVGRGLMAPRHISGEETVRCPEPPPHLRSCWRNANTPAEIETILNP